MGASRSFTRASPNDASGPASQQQFATLEPRVKKVSEATIRKKWRLLPVPAQEKVRLMLLNMKEKRVGGGGAGRVPPLNRRRTTNKKTTSSVKEEDYAKAVEEIADKLLSRLPRMPFPPTSSTTRDNGSAAAGDTPFDLSNTLHRVASLQTQLNTNVQSAHLLRRQIRLEKQALKRDRAELAGLETALKANKQLRLQQAKNLHPLARNLNGEQDDENDDDTTKEIERVNAVAGICATPQSSLLLTSSTSLSTPSNLPPTLDPDSDPNLKPLLAQLTSHLVSMRNNVAGMKPVLEAMDEAKVALDSFVAGKLDHAAMRRLYGL